MKTIITLLLLSFSSSLLAQNIFPVKLDKCKAERFCLDCGDVKAGYQEAEFNKLLERLNSSLVLYGVSGAVKFQVLIQPNGKGCVLSHTDDSGSPISAGIIKELNKFNKWTPASSEGKVLEDASSIKLVFTIKDNIIDGKVERVDIAEFGKRFDKPVDPDIFNKTYIYKNDNLKNYNITVWNSSNSDLPNNFNNNISIDKDGLIWMSIRGGMVTFDGTHFTRNEQDINDKGEFFGYSAVETDNDNTKWFFARGGVYSYSNQKWTYHKPDELGFESGYDIINNPGSDEVFFCTEEGLRIYKKGNWSVINKGNLSQLPSDRITFAKRDSKNRLWIGTYDGSVMIDGNKVIEYEKGKTALKGKCILSMDEDKEGNVYFSVYENDPKDPESRNRDEGLIIVSADGLVKQLTTDNSGIPGNETSDVLYDSNENILWIISATAGLIRYDLKDGWENYHNLNSAIPTSFLTDMTFDSEGNLYITSRQGLIRITKKTD